MTPPETAIVYIEHSNNLYDETPALGDLLEIIGEFFFFDDEETIFVGLDQPEVVKSLRYQKQSPQSGKR